MARLFISYRRSGDLDAELARFLYDGLTAAGHEVFIDYKMPVGTKWAKEIGEQIERCDYLVVLLSEESALSEMVQGEVREAHQSPKAGGRPTILPIRLRFQGRVNYELNSYLAPIQYIEWDGEADSPRVLNEVLRATSGLQETTPRYDPGPTPAPAPHDARRPVPVGGPMAVMVPPGGTSAIDDEFYVKRRADAIVAAVAAQVGETIVIKAPRQMGKSSLLIRYLEACRATKRLAFVNLQSFADTDLDDYTTFLRALIGQWLRALRLPNGSPTPVDSQADFVAFVEDHILAQLGQPVTFALDEVDRIVGRPYQRDFFGMMRTWHNNRGNPDSHWKPVDLAMVISAEAAALIESPDQSPFNVAVPIELQPFDLASLQELNARYGAHLSDDEVTQLSVLLDGHPFLARLAFYRVVAEGVSFQELHDHAAETGGPFGDHLQSRLYWLQKNELLGPMRRIATLPARLDDRTYERLRSAGLACRKDGMVTPTNELYRRFFATIE